MGSPSELSIDYKPNSYRAIQKPFGDQPDQTQKLKEFLDRLEEERLKIEAFKRELPLCMQLLSNAVEAYKQQLEGYQENQEGALRPVLEEFIPIKNMSLGGSEMAQAANAQSEKANWMVSAQLWSPAGDAATKQQQQQTTEGIKENEQSFNVTSPKLALDTKQRGFLPFSKARGSGSASRDVLPELALGSPEKDMDEKCSELESGGMGGRRGGCSKGRGTSGVGEQVKGGSSAADGQSANQSHRKARRCWSPELHRRFVNALQILGGSQVATPKQIRELMKVDGLTNDEVKSHLQKYRLHTRRPIIPGPQTATAAPPQLVVLGGIWVPSEYAAAAAAAGSQAIYGAHPAPSHYGTMQQDFYPAPQPHHHHHHHHHLHPPPLHCATATATSPSAYKGRSTSSNGSPESELRSGGERSESIDEGTVERGEVQEEEEDEGEETEEDERSEEKALVAVKESDVALKF